MALTKSQTYAIGVFTITTDLRAMIEVLGIERTISLARALNSDLNSRRSVDARNRSLKIKSLREKTVSKKTLKLTPLAQRNLNLFDKGLK